MVLVFILCRTPCGCNETLRSDAVSLRRHGGDDEEPRKILKSANVRSPLHRSLRTAPNEREAIPCITQPPPPAPSTAVRAELAEAMAKPPLRYETTDFFRSTFLCVADFSMRSK